MYQTKSQSLPFLHFRLSGKDHCCHYDKWSKKGIISIRWQLLLNVWCLPWNFLPSSTFTILSSCYLGWGWGIFGVLRKQLSFDQFCSFMVINILPWHEERFPSKWSCVFCSSKLPISLSTFSLYCYRFWEDDEQLEHELLPQIWNSVWWYFFFF